MTERTEYHMYWVSDTDEAGCIESWCSCGKWELDAQVNLLHAQGPERAEEMVRADLREQHGKHLSAVRKKQDGTLAPLHIEMLPPTPKLLLQQSGAVEVLVSQAGRELGRVFMNTRDGEMRFEAWLPDDRGCSPVYGSCPEAVEWLVREARDE